MAELLGQAPAVFAVGASARADTTVESRLTELEDMNALRRLSAEFIERINAGDAVVPDTGIVRISAADFDRNAQVEINAERSLALVRLPCEVCVDEPIDAPGSVLVDMARLQDEGAVRQTYSRIAKLSCARAASGWSVARAQFEDDIC